MCMFDHGHSILFVACLLACLLACLFCFRIVVGVVVVGLLCVEGLFNSVGGRREEVRFVG